jgi:site-specific DNA-methyltransferase (adenine-specific)
MSVEWVNIGPHRLACGDCLEILPTLSGVDAVVTDPPYGIGKDDWDNEIPNWLPLVEGIPTAAFCGVVGMRDYPTPDWCGAWVRAGSVQRNGRFGGFNNWEPSLFFNIKRLANDTISEPNYHDKTGHPTTKPTRLMVRLVERMPGETICDPFMGSGTTGVACQRLGRKFIGIEREPKYFDIACRRIEEAMKAEPLLEGVA